MQDICQVIADADTFDRATRLLEVVKQAGPRGDAAAMLVAFSEYETFARPAVRRAFGPRVESAMFDSFCAGATFRDGFLILEER